VSEGVRWLAALVVSAFASMEFVDVVKLLVLAMAAAACGQSQQNRPALSRAVASPDSQPRARAGAVPDVLEIANGYGGKLLIFNPRMTTPLRNIVRADSFYVDPSHPDSRQPPQYHVLLHSPLSTGTDTVGGNPAWIVDDRLGWAELFNPNMRGVITGDDIVTIGVLTPLAAMEKYGKHGRNGAIVLTTKARESPDEPGRIISGGAAFDAAISDTTRPMPGELNIRLVVDTTGHVDPASFVIICRRTPGAFLEPAQKEAILGAVWQPARLRGRPVWKNKYFGVNTLVDSTRTAGDGISLCGY